MIRNNKVIIIALLAGISIFSIYKYVITLKEKYSLIQAIKLVEERSAALEKEKRNLLQELEKEINWQQKLESENTELKVNLKNNESRTLQIKDDLVKTEKTVEQLNLQVASIKAEKATLEEQNNKLKLDLAALSRSSALELKDARKRTSGGAQNQATEGNQGYVIKDGKSTFPAKVVIEVNPALNK